MPTFTPKGLHIRKAETSDIPDIRQVLQRSVREVCAKDHGFDREVLESWHANKTDENLRAWIQAPSNYFIVASIEDRVVGVGLCRLDGVCIDLCYLLPEALHRGVGSAILSALEQALMAAGHHQVSLHSTKTAYGFYQRHGYRPDGEPVRWGKIICYPMKKRLEV